MILKNMVMYFTCVTCICNICIPFSNHMHKRQTILKDKMSLKSHDINLETFQRTYGMTTFTFMKWKILVIIKALSQLCKGQLHEFCFAILVYHRSNPRTSFTASNLSLLLSSMSSSAYPYFLRGHHSMC